MNFIGRLAFYISAGIFSSLLGWSISQLLWIDLGSFIASFINLFGLGTKFELPPFLILIVVTPCIAIAMVVIEIFVSNPTRYKANWRILKRTSIPVVTTTGIISGAILSLLNWYLLASNWSSFHVRLLSWSLIGLFVGLAESVSWAYCSIEGSGRKARSRVIQSMFLGTFAGLIAAATYNSVRQNFGKYQESIGFVLLGIFLGAVLSFASRPSYQVALRAGHGFESVNSDSNLFPELSNKRFSQKVFSFIPVPEGKNDNRIEEGLSIKLPTAVSKNKPIVIGSHQEADIFIPCIPERCLCLWVETSGVKIECSHQQTVKIQEEMLSKGQTKTLRHNQILTLYYQSNPKEFYRFIFYDRFLDPQA